MTSDTQRNDLLEQFQHYLEHSNQQAFTAQEQPDLNTLLSEMIGLKAEVKAESRHYKNTLDTLSSALSTVQADNKTLSHELALSSERLQQQQVEMMRTMMQEIVEIYDRLSSSLEILQNYQPVSTLFKKSRIKDVHLIEGFAQGQLMTVQRVERLLQQYQVKIIDCIGKPLDPATMNAVETGHDPELENGIVLEELRKGFLFQDQVLRLAEVKVNKTS